MDALAFTAWTTRDSAADVGSPAARGRRVGVPGAPAAGGRRSRHVGIRVDAGGGDARLFQHGEEFAAAASDVEDVRRSGEYRRVRAQSRGDLAVAAAELVLEADVLVVVVLTGEVGARRARAARRGIARSGLGRAALEHLDRALQHADLRVELRHRLERARERVDS